MKVGQFLRITFRNTGAGNPIAPKVKQQRRTPACLNRELLLQLRWEKVWYLEERSALQEYHRTAVCVCSKKIWKAKVQWELKLASVVSVNQKKFF